MQCGGPTARHQDGILIGKFDALLIISRNRRSSSSLFNSNSRLVAGCHKLHVSFEYEGEPCPVKVEGTELFKFWRTERRLAEQPPHEWAPYRSQIHNLPT